MHSNIFSLILLFVSVSSFLLEPGESPLYNPYDGNLKSNDRPSKEGFEPLPVSVLPEDTSILSSKNMPSERFRPEVGNGHIASTMHGDIIFMNGLYNGANVTSHRARIPSTIAYIPTSTQPAGLNRKYSIDFGRGLFTESYTGNGVSIFIRSYAHRLLDRVLVVEVILARENSSTPVEVTLSLNSGNKSEDIDFQKDPDDNNFLKGVTKEAEYPKQAPTTKIFITASGFLEGKLSMTSGRTAETFLALTGIGVNKTKIQEHYNEAKRLFFKGTLLQSHVAEWSRTLNRGRIDITGDPQMSKINYGCFYYLLSSIPVRENEKDWPYIGLSPGGLARGIPGRDYYGHVFWDQGIWMFPALALLYHDLGKTMVETRTKTIDASKINAKLSNWEGARYAWESAYTGMETCPALDPLLYEIHINGDVPMMARQYWQLTQDRETMDQGRGAEIMYETAKYWSSRVVYNATDDTYRIQHAEGPDEYHANVSDNAFTNVIAKITLRLANQYAQIFGKPVNDTWRKISEKMYVPYDPVLDYHPEFEGYQPHMKIKQADAILLGYPLMVSMNKSTRLNDMLIYDKATEPAHAPAMSWSVSLINWLEMNNVSRANDILKLSVRNAQKPFNTWTEDAAGTGAVNFLTGMGGHLQSLLFGYAGCRIYDDRLTFNPRLLPKTSNMKITGIDYRGGEFNLQYDKYTLSIVLTSLEPNVKGLQIKLSSSRAWQTLQVGVPIGTSRQAFQIRSS